MLRVPDIFQPPSGGCVLKQTISRTAFTGTEPAAFGRLCVETASVPPTIVSKTPAAFGRLCVETNNVEGLSDLINPSRLRAAVC